MTAILDNIFAFAVAIVLTAAILAGILVAIAVLPPLVLAFILAAAGGWALADLAVVLRRR